MKKYSAVVKDGARVVFIKNQEYQRKADFIHDLRANGYKVNPKKVKPADVFEYILKVPAVDEYLSPVIASVPLQLLAYYIAEFLGKDVDQPRNLAKSVTVE